MREWWSKLRALVAGRRGMDEDLREEMAAHLEFEIRDDIANGKSPDAAREAARRRFGNRTQIQELTREAWSFREVETLVQDLRYGGSGGPRRWRSEPRRCLRFGPAGSGQAGHGELLFSDGRGAARGKGLHP